MPTATTAFTYYLPGDSGPQAAGLVKDAYLGAPLSSGRCTAQTSTSKYHNDYNANGTLKDTVDPNGSAAAADQTTYSYWAAGDTGLAAHGVGELKSVVKPGGSCGAPRSLCTSYTYDGLGRVATMTDGRGEVTSYTYDTADHTTQVLSHGATQCVPAQGTCVQYTYDGEGNLTQLDAAGVTSFTYDLLNQQRTQTTPDGVVVTSVYDGVANLTEYDQSVPVAATGTIPATTYTDTVGYTYNRANQPAKVTINAGTSGARVISLVPNQDGKVKEIDFPTSTKSQVSYGYKKSGKVDTVNIKPDATKTALATYAYDYTTSGGAERTELQKLTTTGPDELDSGTLTYSYDTRGQLTSANDTNSRYPSISYTYDPAGNLTTRTSSGSDTFYGYDMTGNPCWSGPTNGTKIARTCAATPTGDTRLGHDDAGNNTGPTTSSGTGGGTDIQALT